MKTLIILSAFLLVLASCKKDCPVPDPDTDQVYTSDPGQDTYDDPGQDPDNDPGQDPGDDSGDDGDPSDGSAIHHPAGTAGGSTASHFNDGSKKN